MEIILLQDLKSLGKSGDTIKVKDGYANNYLIPKKLAVPYSKNAIKTVELKKKKELALAEKEKAKHITLAATLSKVSLNIAVEAGVNDLLFGSVTSESISNALRKENIQIDKKCITINEPINKLGVYTVEVKLHPEVKQDVRVWVVKK